MVKFLKDYNLKYLYQLLFLVLQKLKEELYFVIFSGEETRNLGWEYILDNIYINYTNIENEAIRIIRNILINMEAFNNELEIRNVNS